MNVNTKTITRLKSQYGDRVLITGATSGIGKALAMKFGQAGFNLILTGRRKQLLESFCTELFDQFKIEAVPIQGDLTRPEDVNHLLKEVTDLNPGIIVLNAGFGTSGKFINSRIEDELNMLELNCKTVLKMAHHFIGKMRLDQRKGAIVLLSSMVGFQGVPNAAHYAATKAYVQSLGEGLAVELKEHGIDILAAAPGPVASEFAERANMKMDMSMKPEDIAVPIIKAIGRKSTLLPGRLTKLLVYSLRTAPRFLRVRIMGQVMGGFTRHQV